jgi:hypothetical protein
VSNTDENCSVRDIIPTFRLHLDQISIAEFVGDVPTDTENDNCMVEVASIKQSGVEMMHITNYLLLVAFALQPY